MPSSERGFSVILLVSAALPLLASEPIARSQSNQELKEEFQQLLDRDAAAWNRGDLEGFMASYAEDVVFVTPTGVTRGRQAVRDRFRPRFEGAGERGELTLIVGEARSLARDTSGKVVAASVVASWRLTFPDRPERSGWTLLVLERSPEFGWQIVQDASF